MEESKKLRTKYTNDDKGYLYGFRSRPGQWMTFIVRRALVELLNSADIRTRDFKSILDIGCGSGELLRFFAELRGTTDGLNGIDLDQEAIDLALKVNPAINLRQGNILTADFGKQDCIMAFVVCMFIKDEQQLQRLFDKIADSLPLGGYFILMETGSGGAEHYRNWHPDDYQKFLAKNFDLVSQKGLFGIVKQGPSYNATHYMAECRPLAEIADIEDHSNLGYSNIIMLLRKK